MKDIFISVTLILLALAVHFSLFEWKTGNTHYSMYMSDVRHLNPEERNKQLFIQIGKSEYSEEQKYEGYRRGYGIFFRDYIATPKLQTVAVFSGVVGSFILILVSVYLILFRGKNS